MARETEQETEPEDDRREGRRSPLIHIGLAKAGSTWLQEVFFPADDLQIEHVGSSKTDVYFRIVEPERVGFDATQTRERFQKLIRETPGIPVISSERLAGNPHSGGYDRFELADRLKEIFPEGRILFMIREQRSAIVSAYKQYLKIGGSASIEEYVNPPYKRAGRVPNFDFGFFFYDRLIEYYHESFGRDSVLVRPIELLKHDPERFVVSVLNFVEHPGNIDELAAKLLELTDVRKNVALSPGMLRWKRHLNMMMGRNDINPGVPLGGLAPGNRLVNKVLRSASGMLPEWLYDTEGQWREEVERLVGNRFATSNRRSSQLTGIDLGTFGYDV